MHDYSVSEEAGQKVDEDMDHLKEGWARLCEKIESDHRGQASGQVVEVVPRGKRCAINTVS